ncbi:PfWMP3_05 [Phormidium phage Pf-WMP3]|uniref:PfWMP3_05 n=1 Tax=Phormidium phage Pf-WMP3 TaxID=2914005 RepID=A5HL56_9CAUD|nr:PfWMP3_05 [Phormidium phage Pf-WMP3]ABQ12445.1 PfWMP3_05 [Phormidium phage Pf-WMP3]
MSMNYVDQQFAYGRAKEQAVKNRLKLIGFTVEESSLTEDKHDDIDFYLIDPQGVRTAVSLKSPHKKGQDICLELYHLKSEVFNHPFKGVIKRTLDERRVPSWYFTSKADVLMVYYPDGTIYYFWMSLLRKFVDGATYIKTQQLSKATQEKLKASGYYYTNNENKWVPRDLLLSAEVGYQLC